MKKDLNKRINNQKGFTLVETLVAIFILIVSITGPLAVAQNGLRAAFLSRDQTTAFYLAQDALEYIKNVRDDNMIANINGSSVDWLAGLSDCEDVDGCTVDTTSSAGIVATCSIGNEGCSSSSPLHYNSATGEFGFTGTDSLFSRLISINEINADQEAEVTITITWTSSPGVGEREIEVRENIFHWLKI